jgi:hypothetical protein
MNETIKEILKDLLSSRTLFAFLIYISFSYLSLTGKIPAEIITNVLFSLMSFYFGHTVGKKNGEADNGKQG